MCVVRYDSFDDTTLRTFSMVPILESFSTASDDENADDWSLVPNITPLLEEDILRGIFCNCASHRTQKGEEHEHDVSHARHLTNSLGWLPLRTAELARPARPET